MNRQRFGRKSTVFLVGVLAFGGAWQAHGLAQSRHAHRASPSQQKANALVDVVREATERHKDVAVAEAAGAMVTGRWTDIGKFKGPVLRSLAARAPFFHDGSAASLAEVIDFYDTRLGIRLTEHLTEQEKADLLAFLRAL